MNVELAQELVDQLGSSLEKLETQHAALFQFLKDQGVVTDEQLAPYLTQAGKSSGVRWRASRIRLDALLNAEKTKEEEAAEKEKQRKREERTPGQNQGKDGQSQQSQDQAIQSKGGPEKDHAQKDGQETSDQDKASQEKNTKPEAEESSGKPAAKEQEEDAKIAEQAYSSIPTSEPASETGKR